MRPELRLFLFPVPYLLIKRLRCSSGMIDMLGSRYSRTCVHISNVQMSLDAMSRCVFFVFSIHIIPHHDMGILSCTTWQNNSQDGAKDNMACYRALAASPSNCFALTNLLLDPRYFIRNCFCGEKINLRTQPSLPVSQALAPCARQPGFRAR